MKIRERRRSKTSQPGVSRSSPGSGDEVEAMLASTAHAQRERARFRDVTSKVSELGDEKRDIAEKRKFLTREENKNFGKARVTYLSEN